VSAPVAWHELECGSYTADLSLWDELAGRAGGPVLEIGAGTGRVALHLARRGFEVHAVDVEEALVEALRARAGEDALAVRAVRADARGEPPAEGAYPLVIAAMQLIQLLGGPEGRAAALAAIRRALAPGGIAALALVEGAEDTVGDAGPGTMPDVREVDGWVHSSLPVEVSAANGRLEVRRLRQLVSPVGELTESLHVDSLDVLDASTLETEAMGVGLARAGRRLVPESELHVASSVVLLEREA
jgi:SAM-dependent methyltransferase